MSSKKEFKNVLADGDLLVQYRVLAPRTTALTIQSSIPKRNLGAALGAIQNLLPRTGALRARWRPAQGGARAHIIVNYSRELDPETRLRDGKVYVEAIKLLG